MPLELLETGKFCTPKFTFRRLIGEGQEKGEIATQQRHPSSVTASNTAPKILPEIGITRRQSYTFKAIEAVPEEKFENMRQGERTDIKPSANWREVVSHGGDRPSKKDSNFDQAILPDGISQAGSSRGADS